LRLIEAVMEVNRPAYAIAREHIPCSGRDHLHKELARIEALCGEGLMLREAGSRYTAVRSSTLLKVRPSMTLRPVSLAMSQERGATRAVWEPSSSRWPTAFSSISARASATRSECSHPRFGSMVAFRYRELSDASVPRFASFVGVVDDSFTPTLFERGEDIMPATTNPTRRRGWKAGPR
jgi:DNA ligase-1